MQPIEHLVACDANLRRPVLVLAFPLSERSIFLEAPAREERDHGASFYFYTVPPHSLYTHFSLSLSLFFASFAIRSFRLHVRSFNTRRSIYTVIRFLNLRDSSHLSVLYFLFYFLLLLPIKPLLRDYYLDLRRI